MESPTIKTHKLNSHYLPHQFFLLSKGYNAGKPLDEPCPNCFVITAANLEEKGKLYWICYSLWKSGTYIPLLVGSVIPFIRINDVAAEIAKAVDYVSVNQNEFDATVLKLQQLMHTEKLLGLQLKLIDGIKSSLTRRMIQNR